MSVDNARDALPLWLASIPDPFTPTQGRDAAEAALADADAVIGNVKAKFQGTLPPGWPRTPALDKAIDDVEITRDAMAALDKGVALSWPKTSGKVGPTLIRVGTALYARLADIEGKAAKADTMEDLLKKIPKLPDPSSLFGGLTAVLLIGAGIWALSEGRKLQRLIDGT